MRFAGFFLFNLPNGIGATTNWSDDGDLIRFQFDQVLSRRPHENIMQTGSGRPSARRHRAAVLIRLPDPRAHRADAEQFAARPFFTLEKAQDGHVILKYCKRKNLSPMAAIFGQMNIYVAREI